MELKVSFLEADSEMPVSFGDVQTVSVDDSKVGSLPWSSKNTVDKLCPSFSESGSAVRCEPVEGYPLNVTTHLPEEGAESITLTQCGKNLFDCEAYTFANKIIYYNTGSANNSSGYSAVEAYIPIGHLKGQTITLNHPASEKDVNTNGGLCFYDADKKAISGSNKHTHIVPENAEYMRFSIPRDYANGTQIQIELGDSVTEFEPYREPVQYTAVAASAIHAWSGVKAIAGVNTIWSSVGTTSVEGKSDPVAIIEKLTNAIISLGSNV